MNTTSIYIEIQLDNGHVVSGYVYCPMSSPDGMFDGHAFMKTRIMDLVKSAEIITVDQKNHSEIIFTKHITCITMHPKPAGTANSSDLMTIS